MKKFLILFVAILILSLPPSAWAYYESAGPGDLRSNVYPNNPALNQKTSLTLGSYTINLDACNISWTQDDKQVEAGIGQKSFSFFTGELGKSVKISAQLNCPGRELMTKDWLFQSNDVEFLISVDTYTPPFYRGSSLITPKSSVKIIALPQVFSTTGELTGEENLVYKWTKNGKAMPNASGYGKYTITTEANELPSTTNFAVEISTLLGEIKVFKSLTIDIENPKLVIYENKPLLGVQYQTGLEKNLNLNKNETTLTAEPFFFSKSDIAKGNTVFGWLMNGKKINQSPDGRSITLRQNEGQAGEATITVQVNSSNNIFSKAQNTLKINFGQKTPLLGF